MLAAALFLPDDSLSESEPPPEAPEASCGSFPLSVPVEVSDDLAVDFPLDVELLVDEVGLELDPEGVVDDGDDDELPLLVVEVVEVPVDDDVDEEVVVLVVLVVVLLLELAADTLFSLVLESAAWDQGTFPPTKAESEMPVTDEM
ncbi:hypothetical protein GGI21_006619 [Coemansia aciculifera]|nr:hypothetical protein GGI21_006619 [Coemansia aciculifera]